MHRIRLKILALRRGMADLVTGPLAFALLPALLLAAFRAGGETALLVAAIALPLALFTIAMVERGALRLSDHQRRGTDPVSGRSFEDTLDRALVTGARRGVQTGCIMLELEAHDRVLRGQGPQAAQAMIGRSAQLLRRNLRRDERMFYLGGGRFGLPSPRRRASTRNRWRDWPSASVSGSGPALRRASETLIPVSAVAPRSPRRTAARPRPGSSAPQQQQWAMARPAMTRHSTARGGRRARPARRRRGLAATSPAPWSAVRSGRGFSPSSCSKPAISRASRHWRAGTTPGRASSCRPHSCRLSRRPACTAR